MSRLQILAAVYSAIIGSSAVLASSSGFPPCDALVAAGLEDILYFPADDTYQSSIDSYWSGSVQAVKPWCIVRPETSQDVAEALKALVKTSPAGNWDIAVRGGGHSHWASNNVANGVTIDLQMMNSTTISNSTNVARIEAGARWGSVLEHIEKTGKTITGGREGNVGVAGLTLGGGASFHSARRGFACDDVVNYEVVLGDGSIVQANDEENSDLFKALKGGSNNFGIVTRFVMKTFDAPAGGIYGGLVFMLYDQKDAVLDQFHRFISINADNRDDTETVSFIWTGDEGPMQIAMVALNTAGAANTTSFAPLDGVTKIMDDRRHRTYGEMITEYVSPDGPRSVWFSLCFHNDLKILHKAATLFEAAVAELSAQFSAGSGVTLSFVIQPLAKHFVQADANNVLGLEDSLKEDSVIWLIQAFSATAEQEAIVFAKVAGVTAELEAFAESRSGNTPWRYLNYVNQAQDPLKSYGEANVEFLREVAAKYDPGRVFQERVTGGFKISRVQ